MFSFCRNHMGCHPIAHSTAPLACLDPWAQWTAWQEWSVTPMALSTLPWWTTLSMQLMVSGVLSGSSQQANRQFAYSTISIIFVIVPNLILLISNVYLVCFTSSTVWRIGMDSSCIYTKNTVHKFTLVVKKTKAKNIQYCRKMIYSNQHSELFQLHSYNKL